MLAKARKHLQGLPNVELHVLPLDMKVPFPSGEFDFIYFYHVSEHLEREDAFRALREIRRCLKPTGRCLIQFSLLHHLDNQAEFRKWERLGDEDDVRSRFYTEEEVMLLLGMVRLHPMLRFYIPGEIAIVASARRNETLGQMPHLQLNCARTHQ
jgi:SAM-dependent methyltransferase